MKKKLQVSPLDPILIRDGRPFDRVPGIRAHTLDDVLPNTFAGSIRTALIKKESSPSVRENLKKLDVRGPLYRWRESLYFLAPLDLEWHQAQSSNQTEPLVTAYPIRPKKPCTDDKASSGCWGVGKEGLFEDTLWLPLGSGKQKKWKDAPSYVSEKWMLDWLMESTYINKHKSKPQNWLTSNSPSSEASQFVAPLLMKAFDKEERTHTSVDPETYSVKEGELFSTESLVFPDDLKLEAWIEDSSAPISTELGDISELHTLGGKRRLVHLHEVEPHDHVDDNSSFWNCPPMVSENLKNEKYIRMVLATPAYFRKGWIPGWLDENLVSKERGQYQENGNAKYLWKTNIKLQLRWACVPRWQPVSGWAYDLRTNGDQRLPQERMVRRMVPAGSVYFFEVLEGDPSELAQELWLKSVSDRNRRAEAHDREDGFGLALWGSWQMTDHTEKEKENDQ
ncbi:type III-B CRISPR module-associated protein Cmr3 [Saccharibacillus sacchari]|uniref:Type III-B CRISPR module-associated protein Cmr3 n=1 Tax=Saccharibacillus sacchari TaxID=456493 RepID=A0ACC6PBX6_9BACL